MNKDTPFETWRLANMRQVAVSPEILKLLALAFEGGRSTKREWVGLTDEEMRKLADEHLFYQPASYEVSGVFALSRAIQAKIKEKNNGHQ